MAWTGWAGGPRRARGSRGAGRRRTALGAACRRTPGRGSPGARRSADTLADLLALRPRRVAVLATGDPLWFGIGRLLLRHFPPPSCRILPHRLGLPGGLQPGWAGRWRTWPHLTRTGRPVDGLRRHLQPGRRLLVLTADGSAPARSRAAWSTTRLRRQPDLGPGGAGRAGRADGPASRRRPGP